jgi:hypothetical protein
MRRSYLSIVLTESAACGAVVPPFTSHKPQISLLIHSTYYTRWKSSWNMSKAVAKFVRFAICKYMSWPRASVVYSHYKNWLCVARTWTRGRGSETNANECTFGNQGLSSHSEETKTVRFLEFLVGWKIKVNVMMCMHTKWFLAVRNEMLLPLKRGYITFIH